MTLADAIRFGAQKRPQTTDGSVFHLIRSGEWASCALGAAWEGRGGNISEILEVDIGTKERVYTELRQGFPVLATRVACPTDLTWETRMLRMIEWLNDHDHWTRERIAEWIDTLGLEGTHD